MEMKPTLVAEYEDALTRMDSHIKQAPDGTFELTVDAAALNIDPIVFADLKRAIEVTNEKIKSGETNPNDVVRPTLKPAP